MRTASPPCRTPPAALRGVAAVLEAPAVGKLRSLADRFWSKVDCSGGPDSCWLFCGDVRADGYGQISLPRDASRKVKAHRLSWELANGAIPAGFLVLHRCDVPRCVNPRHLFIGTAADNMADMSAKGRVRGAAVPRAVCKHGHDRVPGDRECCPVCKRLRSGGFWPQFLASSSDERRWLSDLVMNRLNRGDSVAA